MQSKQCRRLTAGEELSTTLRQYPKVFKPIAIGLIEAGEAGGILESVLDRIALLMENKQDQRSTDRSLWSIQSSFWS